MYILSCLTRQASIVEHLEGLIEQPLKFKSKHSKWLKKLEFYSKGWTKIWIDPIQKLLFTFQQLMHFNNISKKIKGYNWLYVLLLSLFLLKNKAKCYWLLILLLVELCHERCQRTFYMTYARNPKYEGSPSRHMLNLSVKC